MIFIISIIRDIFLFRKLFFYSLDDKIIDKIKTTLKILITDSSNFIGELAMQMWNEHFSEYTFDLNFMVISYKLSVT